MGRMSFTQELKELAKASEGMDAGSCWGEVPIFGPVLTANECAAAPMCRSSGARRRNQSAEREGSCRRRAHPAARAEAFLTQQLEPPLVLEHASPSRSQA